MFAGDLFVYIMCLRVIFVCMFCVCVFLCVYVLCLRVFLGVYFVFAGVVVCLICVCGRFCVCGCFCVVVFVCLWLFCVFVGGH